MKRTLSVTPSLAFATALAALVACGPKAEPAAPTVTETAAPTPTDGAPDAAAAAPIEAAPPADAAAAA
ncbi:MAG: hypothetical protein CVU56_26320, partial [Deltaproteobacteria bacterium HGW-Deltaproteobacteria-14]